MNILAGTFRLSIVVALVVGGFDASKHLDEYNAEQAFHRQYNRTVSCGAALDSKLIERSKADDGKIDLGKLGCADQAFWTDVEELKEAAKGKFANFGLARPFSYGSLFIAIGALILTNLIGLVCWWVVRGFKKGV